MKLVFLLFIILTASFGCHVGSNNPPNWSKPNIKDPLYPTIIFTLKDDIKSKELVKQIEAKGFRVRKAKYSVDKEFPYCKVNELPQVCYSWTSVDGRTDHGEALQYCDYKESFKYVNKTFHYVSKEYMPFLLDVDEYEVDPNLKVNRFFK